MLYFNILLLFKIKLYKIFGYQNVDVSDTYRKLTCLKISTQHLSTPFHAYVKKYYVASEHEKFWTERMNFKVNKQKYNNKNKYIYRAELTFSTFFIPHFS